MPSPTASLNQVIWESVPQVAALVVGVLEVYSTTFALQEKLHVGDYLPIARCSVQGGF